MTSWGAPASLMTAETPVPHGGQVLVAVEGAGLCQSDLHVVDAAPGDLPFRLPFTLGHEVAGRVRAVGPEVREVAVGHPMLVYGPWGCGTCPRCAVGRENYCDRRSALGYSGMGLGIDGGIADTVLVHAERHLVPLGGLDPVAAAPLADAALTPMHAVAGCRDRLGPGSTAIVVGVGGLGHLAVQILRAVTGAAVVAVDVRDEALALARAHGAAHTLRPGPDATATVRDLTAGVGADAAFDFVGSDATVAFAASILRADGDLVVVGSAGGALLVRKGASLPQGVRVSLPFWGTLPELREVVALAGAGDLHVEVEHFPLSCVDEAVARLRAGTLTGRAVLVPD